MARIAKDMKLTSISATVVHPSKDSIEGIPFVEVRSDTGLAGWGEAQASRSAAAVCEIVRDLLSPTLRNRDFRGEREEIESLWNELYSLMRNEGQTGGVVLDAIAGLDIALWDLAGKARNQAIHQIAGNPAELAEVGSFTSLSSAELADLPGKMKTMLKAGLDIFELSHDVDEKELILSLDRAKEILHNGGRVAVNARWRLDPGWDFRFERKIDQRGPIWLANPLPPEDPFSYARLSKAMCTPIALGECYHTHYELAPFFHELAVGVLQADVGRCGLTEAFRMAIIAETHNVPITIRVGRSLGPQLAAALQFAATAPGRRVEYSSERLKAANSTLRKPIEFKQGKYRITGAPGLGIQIEEAEIHLMESQAA